jgi:hypothetical protein
MDILIGNKLVQIDEDDLNIIAEHKWSISNNRPTTKINGKTVYLYRLIMNAPVNVEVDHISGNPLDCRKHRMRLCSHHQNLMNRSSNFKSSSKYVGVQKTKTGRWAARIKLSGFNNDKTLNIGTFDSEEEAAIHRDIKAKELFGEFARLNIKGTESNQLTSTYLTKKQLADILYYKVLELTQQGLSPYKIDKILNISRGYASKLIKSKSNSN